MVLRILLGQSLKMSVMVVTIRNNNKKIIKLFKSSCFKSFLTLKREHSDKGTSLKVLQKLFQSAIQLYLVL